MKPCEWTCGDFDIGNLACVNLCHFMVCNAVKIFVPSMSATQGCNSFLHNHNDIFIILTGIYIAKLHSIIPLNLLPSPEGLISQFKTNRISNMFTMVYFSSNFYYMSVNWTLVLTVRRILLKLVSWFRADTCSVPLFSLRLN